ncbi:Ice2p KNAG_0A05390 [Huiozyma naganishii CBS 8797]|uniref:Protein ICE2 n=1 Tax=Huiozyma naganishii (strain ATCC MYA-139 / BCRC 22969 / CBS 8797 / KCTC 17520 / NBRC 10181 / NCYC 3082 / Yp74L-3) TaxID=1071383 RepID=J7S2J2_HUIN7|nr:hypothetical protein KNAG_0A05390 [Kazachstania naganishii CBS 8797]CCK68204.1 hypothetical protein KNAG_0A05390 [Kazachstania naganishii CBS 8797]
MTATLTSGFIRGCRICSGALYLLLTLISIPISFKVGGLYCGLAFTATLFILYFVSTTLSIIARKNGNRIYIVLSSILYYCQHFIIASLLHLFLSGFSNAELHKIIENDAIPIESLTSILNVSMSSSEANWIFYYYYYKYVVTPWKFVLSHSTPFFTLSEGFFTILAIQAIGETNKWLCYEKNSNAWIISSLLTSSAVISAALYYLYRIYVTPIWELTVQTASLLGFVLSLVSGLGIYGIVSDSGSVIESSLFFAYIVRCIYEISPKLATTATDELLELFKDVWQKRQGNLPIRNNLIFYYNNVILKNIEMAWDNFILRTGTSGTFNYNPSLLLNNTWKFCKPIWKFFKNFTLSVPFSIREILLMTWKMSLESVSPAVVINLCFRILIFYSATRIVPSLQRKDAREQRRSRKVMELVYWYSPCILIAMYAHLILQYSSELKNELCLWGCNNILLGYNTDQNETVVVDAWRFWNWCNVFCTILVYANELIGDTTHTEIS